jgi:hypothetical protein
MIIPVKNSLKSADCLPLASGTLSFHHTGVEESGVLHRTPTNVVQTLGSYDG